MGSRGIEGVPVETLLKTKRIDLADGDLIRVVKGKGSPLPDTDIVFYQKEDGGTRIQVRMHDGTARLNQRMMAELYQVSVPAINQHISNIYNDRELSSEATIRKLFLWLAKEYAAIAARNSWMNSRLDPPASKE